VVSRASTAEAPPTVEPLGGRDARRIVADGYDAVAERYFAWSDAQPSRVRRAWLDRPLEHARFLWVIARRPEDSSRG
jgi:hypothetical protein